MIWVHEEYYCTSVDRRNLPPVICRTYIFHRFSFVRGRAGCLGRVSV